MTKELYQHCAQALETIVYNALKETKELLFQEEFFYEGEDLRKFLLTALTYNIDKWDKKLSEEWKIND